MASGRAGGIESTLLALRNSTVNGNTAQGGGGGIYNLGALALNGDSSVNQNTVSGNGGGIYNLGSVILNGESSVRRNKASEHGGGIYNDETEGATISYGIGWSGTVSGNSPDDIFNA
jgi:Chlamydia polymorphic membrane protein (Chlamydia_PMP) repeat